MTSLAEKEGLKGKVQMIYIDPPYGIKFGSNWQVSTRKRDVKDGKVEDATRQPEQVRAFRDTWKIGIHSYLAVLRDWLLAARELLTETGSIFVQIGDENVHLVRGILDEVFGSANFISQIVVSTTTSASSAFLDNVGDFVLWYARDREQTKYRGLFLEKSATATGTDLYTWVRHADGTDRRMTNTELTGESALPGGARVFRVDQLTSQTQASTTRYDVMFRGLTYQSGKRQWATPKSGMARLITASRVCVSGSSLAYVRFIRRYPK
jgi:adenine-specific DNA-methyltransferase